MRAFYTERDVVNEERRMRTDSRPVGRMLEQLLAAAFTAHPYGRPVVGWAHGGVGELLRELLPAGAVAPFDAAALLASARALLAPPDAGLSATMPARLQRYSLAAMVRVATRTER